MDKGKDAKVKVKINFTVILTAFLSKSLCKIINYFFRFRVLSIFK